MFRPVRLIAAFSILSLALPLRGDTPPKTVAVPFELLRSRHIAVQVKINGKGPYRMIFDTGAPVMLVNTKVAKESGLMTRPAKKSGGFAALGQYTIDKMEIGDLRADNVATAVLDHPTVTAISKALGPIEGLVGFPFFARYRTAIDYQATELTFTPNGYQPKDIMQAVMASMMGPRGRNQPAGPRVLAPAAVWGLNVEKLDGDREAGVNVREIYAGSPADRAGLLAGDRLLTIDGRWTESVTDCFQITADIPADQATEVVVRRTGREHRLRVAPKSGL